MSDLAVRDLETRRDSLFGSLRNLLLAVFGRESNHHLPQGIQARQAYTLWSTASATRKPAPDLRVVQQQRTPHNSEAVGDRRWARHPQLRSHQASAVPATGQRSARLEAERGLILARGGKLVEAVEAFTNAAHDPEIDLGALPGFWDLPRNGMLTAVRAYKRTGRLRDAAALEARIRHLLRPRAIRPVPTRPSRLSASGD